MRYKCTVTYDGCNFHGFQIQKNKRSVQEEIEKAVTHITKINTKIHPASRTDSGVHSYGQVFHFDCNLDIEEQNLKIAINSCLPNDVYIKSVESTSDNFHARYDSIRKVYHYLIDIGEYNPLYYNYRYYYSYKIDIKKMIEASKIFIGEHDFKAFTKNKSIENTVRTIYNIDFVIDKSLVLIKFHGNGFMHNMVRIIVAMLLEVGRGKITCEQLQQIMQSKDRKLAPKTAPSRGLYLMEVNY